jgi:AbrB family looped-hinge helix DNA binding protein
MVLASNNPDGVGARMTVQVNITPNGRMSLPADIRKRLGLVGGGAVYLDETPDGLVLRTAAQAVARAQALAKQYTEGNPHASVEAFLAKRREDSGE